MWSFFCAGTFFIALCFICADAYRYYSAMRNSPPIQFFNRETRQLETEEVFGEGALRWVYETHLGTVAREILIRRAVFSRIYGKIMSRPASAARIRPFIEKYKIDPEAFAAPVESFASFNDFFSRKLKPAARPILADANAATLPADGRHLAFQKISGAATTIYAKGQCFNLEKFIGDPALAKRYENGTLVCSRLCPTDYHRFHFPVAGTPRAPEIIAGTLYSVNPIALAKNINYLCENKRVRVEIDSPRFGKVLQILVGATNVGTIVPTFSAGTFHEKGAELGYFRFGGSFVATFFEAGKIEIAQDLLENTAAGRETYAKIGTLLGTAKE